jgi:hypothetical protein
VEGALLEFYLSGPMHWLGMVDLAEDAARMTAYGRAFISDEQWPQPNIPVDKIIVQDDGTMLISRRVPLIDRFQAMRFTAWDAAGDGSPYTFKLNADGIKRATTQGIGNDNIIAFLSRVLEGKPLPQTITKLLEAWQSGPTSNATIERLMVLRTTSTETMDFIVNTPALRRYLGSRLGDMATVVRADQWEDLRDALGEQGIDVAVVE